MRAAVWATAWIGLALALAASAPRAAAYELLLLRQDWAPNAAQDPACVNSACSNKLQYGAFTIRDLAPSDSMTLGLAGCQGPAFDASQIPQPVASELSCVLSPAESAWEATWNTQGACSGLNVSQYFTFMAATYNLFAANAPLAAAGVVLPSVDRDALLAALQAAWGVKPYAACNPSTKALLYVTLCLDPSAAAAGIMAPVDCPWDPSSDVPGGVECAGLLTLQAGTEPSATCAAYYPALLESTSPEAIAASPEASEAAPEFDASAALGTPSGGGAAGGSALVGGVPSPAGAPSRGQGAPGAAETAPAAGATKPAAGSVAPTAEAQLPPNAPALVSQGGWSARPAGEALNPGSAVVASGAEFLQALSRNLGNVTLAADIGFTPGDFHFQEYTLPLNLSGVVWVHAADPAAPVVVDWSNVSGLINVFDNSTLVLGGIVSQNVGDAQEAINDRTVRVQVVGSPIWPTVTGANGHQVVLADSWLVVPDPDLFLQASAVLRNASAPANGGGGGLDYANLTVITPVLSLIDVTQLAGVGMGDSYTAGRSLYSLSNTRSSTAAPQPQPQPPDSGGGGLSAGAIAGIAVGAAVAAVAVLAALFVWRRRRATAKVADPGKGAAAKAAPSAGGGKGAGGGGMGKGGAPFGGGGGSAGQIAAAAQVVVVVGGDGMSDAERDAATASTASGASSAQPRLARSGSGGSAPDTTRSVLPGAGNPFHSTSTGKSGGKAAGGDAEDLFLSYVRSRLPAVAVADGGSPRAVASPRSATSGPTTATGLTPGGAPPSRQSSLGPQPPSRQASLTPPQATRQTSLGPLSRRGTLSTSESALWAIPFEQIELHERIGEGAFGRVYRGEWRATPVAVKLLLAQAQLQDGGSIAEAMSLSKPTTVLCRLQEEADLMFSLRHPNCVQLMGTCLAPPCLITEFCARGSLADCLREARRQPGAAAELSWRRRLAMGLDAAKGMLYLHSYQPPIVHRDLKSPNLLVDKDWNVKVADFNLSKILGEDHSSSQEVTNPRWLAPEVLQGELATPPSDVFGFGVVLWEMLTFQLPWAQGTVPFNPWQLARKVLGGARLPVPPPELLPGPDVPPAPLLAAYVELMQRCWHASPAERPTFAAIATQLRDMLELLPPAAGG